MILVLVSMATAQNWPLPDTPITAQAVRYQIWEIHSDGYTPALLLDDYALDVLLYHVSPSDQSYFEVEVCPSAWSSSTIDAIEAFQAVDIPFSHSFVGALDCYYTPAPPS